MHILKKANFKQSSLPVALLLLCLASFGVLLPTLGFYWDDWAKILVHRLFGLSGYWQYYAGDRPLSAWTHILLTPLLGDSPLPWHLFTLAMRWLSAVGLWWSLANLWPQARRLAASAALLFAVYPVFTQQPIALTFHQQWMQFALYFYSLGAMILAIRKPKQSWIFLSSSLVAILLELSITEYFAPLELVRPIILWFLVTENQAERRKQVSTFFKKLLPYLALTSFYVIWRLFLMHLPGDDPYRAETLYSFLAAPLDTIINLAKVILVDLLHIFLTSWADVLNFQPNNQLPPFTLAAILIAVATAIAIWFYLSHLDENNPEGDGKSSGWLKQALIMGIAAVLLGPVPAWITGRQVVFDFHSNRYALPALFGLSLLCAVFIEWLGRGRSQKAVLTAFLIGLSVIFQLQNANDYRWIWTNQMRLSWQLAWRAPQLKAPTAIISENELIPNQGLFSTSASLNLLYPQSQNSGNLSYWAYTLRPRYAAGASNPPSFSFSTTFRTLKYSGSSPNTILVQNDPTRGNCLWILSPDDKDDPYLPDLTREFLQASNLDRIIPEPNAPGYPPQEFFGAEPAHDWCFYYQKVSLAVQAGDWQQASSLANEALNLGYTPSSSASNSPHEWLPFIEAYAHIGRPQDARQLTLAAFEQDAKYRQRLCSLWENIKKTSETDSGSSEVYRELQNTLNCPNK